MPAKKSTATKTSKKVAKKTTKKAPTESKSKVTKPSVKKTAAKKATTKKTAATSSGAAVVGRHVKAVSGEAVVAPLYGESYVPKKGEEYMSEGMVEHFRGILRAWKRDLMEEVDRTVHHMQDEAANFPDPNDRASQETEFSLALRARDRERKLIKKIEESLELLDDGDYGYCESCGVEIGLRRLEARPTATLCIDCKTLDEIREKQRA